MLQPIFVNVASAIFREMAQLLEKNPRPKADEFKASATALLLCLSHITFPSCDWVALVQELVVLLQESEAHCTPLFLEEKGAVRVAEELVLSLEIKSQGTRGKYEKSLSEHEAIKEEGRNALNIVIDLEAKLDAAKKYCEFVRDEERRMETLVESDQAEMDAVTRAKQ
jgi:hypothetical protein